MIGIPDSSLSKTAKYVLRFKNPASPRSFYNHSSSQISSPGLIIVNSARTSTTSGLTSSTISSSGSIVTSTIATSSATAVAPSGLSTGAKAGIGVGSAIGG